MALNRERTLKPLTGASGCQKATEKSVRSSVFASKSKIPASSKNSSTPSGEVTSFSEEDFTACKIRSGNNTEIFTRHGLNTRFSLNTD